MKRLSLLAVIMGLVAVSIFTCGMSGINSSINDSIDLTILMYHNVIPNNMTANKYEICERDLRADMKYIKKAGYTVVCPEELVRFTRDSKFNLPQKCVMLTFDDGFYYYNKFLGKLLTEYNMSAVVSVVGDFTRLNKNTDATPKYTYMDYDDMAELQNTGRVNIATHSYNLHKLGKRMGAKKIAGESEKEYRNVFMDDCQKIEDKLLAVNIKPICYTYPYGAYCNQSEQMLLERGYKMSLTCQEKVNKITRNREDLFSLGRYNRHGVATSAEKILYKVMPC